MHMYVVCVCATACYSKFIIYPSQNNRQPVAVQFILNAQKCCFGSDCSRILCKTHTAQETQIHKSSHNKEKNV